MHNGTHCKGNSYRGKNTHNNLASLGCIDVVESGEQWLATCKGFDSRYTHCSPQKLENYRYSSRSRQPYRVEEVEEENISKNNRHKDDHHLIEIEELGVKNPFTGNFHHSAGEDSTDGYPSARNYHNCANSCHFRAYGRIEKVRCVVAYTHH